MSSILKYCEYSKINEEVGPFYNKSLSPSIWIKDKEGSWKIDQRVRRKLLRIAKDFFSKFSEILKEKDIVDIQLTGSLSNYNYTDLSDLDVHVIVNLEGIDDDNPKILKSALDGIRFKWNLINNIKIRGHEVEAYIQDEKDPHSASGLFSLLDDEWIKSPVLDPPEIDEADINKKFSGIAYEIDQIAVKLTVTTLPTNAKSFYKRALQLKEKIQKMRRESLSDDGEFSIGDLVFKKLKNEGYIEKLIDAISESYNKIYTEK